MSRDYLMRLITRWEGEQPFDAEGHALNHEEINGATARDLTSPYGSLQYAVGNGDDFHCFDFGKLADGRIALHACVHSETGSFIMDSCYEIVDRRDAVAEAVGLVDQALEWCHDNKIKHGHKGWDQDPYYFARCVARAVGALKRRPVRRAIKNRIPPTDTVIGYTLKPKP